MACKFEYNGKWYTEEELFEIYSKDNTSILGSNPIFYDEDAVRGALKKQVAIGISNVQSNIPFESQKERLARIGANRALSESLTEGSLIIHNETGQLYTFGGANSAGDVLRGEALLSYYEDGLNPDDFFLYDLYPVKIVGNNIISENIDNTSPLFNISEGRFFPNFTIVGEFQPKSKPQEDNLLFQKPELIPSKASASTIRSVKEWLKRAGISEKLLTENDVIARGGINGIANILEGFVGIAEGTESTTLPEESMHFAVAITKQTNLPLYRQMMGKIENYNVYRETLNTYSTTYVKDGKPDIVKIKEEAIARLLVEQIIKQNEGLTEKPELLQTSRTWWENIIALFKGLLSKAGFNPFKKLAADILKGKNIGTLKDLNAGAKPLAERIIAKKLTGDYRTSMQSEYNKGNYAQIVMSLYDQFRDAETMEDRAERLIEGDFTLAEDIINFGRDFGSTSFFQLTEKQQEILTALDEKLRTFGITKVEKEAPTNEDDDVSFYQKMVNGKEERVSQRVSDLVDEKRDPSFRARMENKPAFQKTKDRNKAKFGQAGHRTIESILKAVLSPTGTLLPRSEVVIPPEFELKNEAVKALTDYLIGTDENPGILYQNSIFEAGTVFRTEQIIYDEKRNKDTAGTIDLLAIQPDGRVSIIDWKFIFLDTAKNDDVPFYKQKDIRVQLGQYRQILQTYGIEYNDFHKIQAIPIQVKGTFNTKGDFTASEIILSNPDVRTEKKRWLLPVPVVDQSTGNEQLDRYVKQLYDLHHIIEKQRVTPEERSLKQEQLKGISGAIRELQIKGEFKPFYEQGQAFLRNTEALIEEYYSKFQGRAANDPSISDNQINDFLSRLNATKDNLPKYADMYSVFQEIYGSENLTEEHQKLAGNMSKLSGEALKFIKQIDIIFAGDRKPGSKNTGFVPTFIAERQTGIKGLGLAEKNTDWAGRNFSIQSLVQTKAMATGGNINSNAVQKATIDKQDKQDEYKELVDEFNKAGLAPSLIFDENENTLVKKVEADLYTQFNKATDPLTKDVKWLKENVDLEAYKNDADEWITKRSEQINRENYPLTGEQTIQGEREKKIRELKEKYSIATDNSLGWFDEKMRRHLKLEKYYTPEYRKILNTPAAIALYTFIENFNYYAKRTGYHNNTRSTTGRFLPWIRSSVYDRLKQGEGLKGIYESFQSLWKIYGDEEVHYGVQNPNTGEIGKSVPIFFTKKKDDESYSKDIQKNFALYINSVIDHAYAVEAEDKLLAILDVEKAGNHLDVDGRGNIKLLEGGKLAEIPNNDRNAQLFEEFIDTTIYKERYSKNQPVSPGGVKFIENLNNYMRTKVFGLNLITPLVNTLGSNMQAIINAGKHWKGREFIKNEAKIVQNAFRGEEGNIEKGVIDFFIPLNEDINNINARRMAKDAINKWTITEIILSPLRYADRLVQLATGLTMIENSMLDENNNIVSIREYVRNQSPNRFKSAEDVKKFNEGFNKKIAELKATKSLMKIAKFNKEGYIEIPGIGRKSPQFIDFRRRIQNEIKRINGSLSEEDRRNWDRGVIQRSMAMFKNWIPLTIESRYGGLKENAATHEYQMGRARIFWQVLIHGAKGNIFKGLIGGIKDLKDMSSLNTRGLSLLSEYYKRTAESYYKKTGKKLEMTDAEFFDMVKQAISSQIRDNLMLLSLLSLFLTVKFHAPDDDETDQNKNLYKTSLRIIDKTFDEISFYYNPISFKQILGGNIIPSIGVLTDALSIVDHTGRQWFGGEETREAAHPTKALLKMIPVANWMFNFVIPVVDPEAAKELGIKTSSQSRF